MNANRFDCLSRGIAPRPNRRQLGARLAGGMLTLLPLPAGITAIAKKKDKKKDKKKAKGKKSKSKCSPSCTGAKTCKQGACVCPSGTDECGGECRNSCGVNRARNPFTCDCCTRHGENCFFQNDCCSHVCIVGGAGFCAGLGPGTACSFGGQCSSGNCNGFCGS